MNPPQISICLILLNVLLKSELYLTFILFDNKVLDPQDKLSYSNVSAFDNYKYFYIP